VIRKPDVFIVGAPKCGTTAMDRYLATHPDVFMARKEMHHFGADLRFGSQFYRRDSHDYLREFEGWNGQSRLGEASVWYLFSKHAAEEIKAFNPDSRIIIMLREPSEMMHALYWTFRFDANEHLPTFAEALAAEDERRAGGRRSSRTYFAQGLVYRDAPRYTEQVSRYFEVFGRERVHVLIYDDFAADTRAAYLRTLDFLEVDSTHTRAEFGKINVNQDVKSSALRAVLRNRLLCSTVLAVRPWLPRPIFGILQRVEAALRTSNRRPAERPSMAPELRRQLQREFAPEVERLSKLLGRDLTAWSREDYICPRSLKAPARVPDIQKEAGAWMKELPPLAALREEPDPSA
jgi:Sulfotransferase domain